MPNGHLTGITPGIGGEVITGAKPSGAKPGAVIPALGETPLVAPIIPGVSPNVIQLVIDLYGRPGLEAYLAGYARFIQFLGGNPTLYQLTVTDPGTGESITSNKTYAILPVNQITKANLDILASFRTAPTAETMGVKPTISTFGATPGGERYTIPPQPGEQIGIDPGLTAVISYLQSLEGVEPGYIAKQGYNLAETIAGLVEEVGQGLSGGLYSQNDLVLPATRLPGDITLLSRDNWKGTSDYIKNFPDTYQTYLIPYLFSGGQINQSNITNFTNWLAEPGSLQSFWEGMTNMETSAREAALGNEHYRMLLNQPIIPGQEGQRAQELTRFLESQMMLNRYSLIPRYLQQMITGQENIYWGVPGQHPEDVLAPGKLDLYQSIFPERPQIPIKIPGISELTEKMPQFLEEAQGKKAPEGEWAQLVKRARRFTYL